jgi:hypothetical protein
MVERVEWLSLSSHRLTNARVTSLIAVFYLPPWLLSPFASWSSNSSIWRLGNISYFSLCGRIIDQRLGSGSDDLQSH